VELRLLPDIAAVGAAMRRGAWVTAFAMLAIFLGTAVIVGIVYSCADRPDIANDGSALRLISKMLSQVERFFSKNDGLQPSNEDAERCDGL
jgi:hypothetical protein